MKLNRRGKLLLSAMIGTMASGIAAVYSVFTFFLLNNTVSDDGDGRGNIGLRSYFHTGVGTALRPFVITRPRHFYNLARLQNLGAFSGQTYFQLGYDLTSGGKGNNNGVLDDGEKWLVYTGDSGNETSQVLDMSGSFYRNTIFPVGSEGAPFYGEFNGNNLVISNLTVTSFPEDVGVFGYTAPGSFVHDLFFKDLTVEDAGWDKTVLNPDFYAPAENSITLTATFEDSSTLSNNGEWLENDKLITPQTSFVALTCTGLNSAYSPRFRCSSEYMVESSTVSGKFTFDLEKIASDAGIDAQTEGNVYTRLSVSSNYSTSGHLYSHVLGTFTVNIKCDGDGHYSYNIKRDVYDSENTANDSMSVANYKHGANIGFVFGHCDGAARNIYVDGCSIKMNLGSASARYPLSQESETGLIGEIGASLDKEGTPSDAYENNFETGVVNFTDIYNNVMSPYDTEETYLQVDDNNNGIDGENRTVEFGKNYTDFVPADGTSDDYLEYLRQYHGTNGNLHYLTEYYPNSYYSATSSLAEDVNFSYNLLFAGRKLVADTRDESGKVKVSRGLGVFKMATGSTDTNTVWENSMNGSSEFQIKRGRTFNEVFYTTAEYDSTAEVASGNTTWFNNWKTGVTNGTRIYTPSTLPSFVTENTWCEELEKTSNYVFRTSLDTNANMNNKNYFGNNHNTFLQQYFRYKLMNAGGKKISTTDKNFGVKIQKPGKTNKDAPVNILEFDSYLYCKKTDNIISCPVEKTENFIGDGEIRLFTLANKPLKAPKVTVDGVALQNSEFTWSKESNDITLNSAPDADASIVIDYVYDSGCPAGTINFSIKNTNGANVTIIAGASSERRLYKNDNSHTQQDSPESATASIISIYDKDTCKNGSEILNRNEPGEVTVSKYTSSKPSYSTYIPLLGEKKEEFRYFDYNHLTGAVNPSATLSTDEKYLGTDPSGHKEILYAHTFKIPKPGDYFIYSPTGNTKLYYVCAQGQDEGEIGDAASNFSEDNAIANVDFVRSVPGDAIYSAISQSRYHLNFKAYWSNQPGTMTVGDHDATTTSAASITTAANQESIIIWNNATGQSIYYNGSEKTDNFITDGGGS